MQQRVSQTKMQNVDDLRQRLIDVWNGLEKGVIDNAIDQWLRRLRACIQAKGGHFEYSLWIIILFFKFVLAKSVDNINR